MEFPTPDDPKRAPVWENYVVAQAASASLGLIPAYAQAVGVDVLRTQVTLVVQAPLASAKGDEDLDDIVSELEALLGPGVQVFKRIDPAEVPRLTPHDTVRWFFAART